MYTISIENMLLYGTIISTTNETQPTIISGGKNKMKRIYEKEYKALMIAGTVITNKGQTLRLIKKFNQYFQEDKSVEMALAIDNYTERLVTAGFLTWEEAEEAAF